MSPFYNNCMNHLVLPGFWGASSEALGEVLKVPGFVFLSGTLVLCISRVALKALTKTYPRIIANPNYVNRINNFFQISISVSLLAGILLKSGGEYLASRHVQCSIGNFFL